MNGDEVVGALREIRDELRVTNGRIDQTNTRLQSVDTRLESVDTRLESVDGRLQLVEGRLEFLERSVANGFADVHDTLAEHEKALERQAAAIHELHETVTTQVTAILLNHEQRITTLEQRQ